MVRKFDEVNVFHKETGGGLQWYGCLTIGVQGYVVDFKIFTLLQIMLCKSISSSQANKFPHYQISFVKNANGIYSLGKNFFYKR